MLHNSRIFVAGHKGLVGSAILKRLSSDGFTNLVTRNHNDLDLRNQAAVDHFFKTEKIEYVFLSAAKVGGILANTNYPADFIYDNIMIEANVIRAAAEHNVSKLLFLGSACIYPKICPQPISESYLLSGYLEESNQPYALAKITGLEMCKSFRKQYRKNFISVMPTNLYGLNDNYDLTNSHVFPALVRKFYEANRDNAPCIEIWGDGSPTREFLHVDDLADACLFLMQNYDNEDFLNIGTANEISIKELASLFKKVTRYQGKIVFDPSKPNGTPRRKMDISKILSLGWSPKITLEQGIASVYEDYCSKNF